MTPSHRDNSGIWIGLTNFVNPRNPDLGSRVSICQRITVKRVLVEKAPLFFPKRRILINKIVNKFDKDNSNCALNEGVWHGHEPIKFISTDQFR
jgi:hypothetical protein